MRNLKRQHWVPSPKVSIKAQADTIPGFAPWVNSSRPCLTIAGSVCTPWCPHPLYLHTTLLVFLPTISICTELVEAAVGLWRLYLASGSAPVPLFLDCFHGNSLSPHVPAAILELLRMVMIASNNSVAKAMPMNYEVGHKETQFPQISLEILSP